MSENRQMSSGQPAARQEKTPPKPQQQGSTQAGSQQAGGQQAGSQQAGGQMQSTQFTDWASI